MNTKGHIVPDTIIIGDFNTPLSIFRHIQIKIHKELNCTTDQMNVTNFYKIYRIYILSAVSGTTSEIDHVLAIKLHLNLITEINSGIFSDHHGIKLEIDSKRSHRNCTTM